MNTSLKRIGLAGYTDDELLALCFKVMSTFPSYIADATVEAAMEELTLRCYDKKEKPPDVLA